MDTNAKMALSDIHDFYPDRDLPTGNKDRHPATASQTPPPTRFVYLCIYVETKKKSVISGRFPWLN